mmetsp:Transcript_14976/g.26533  ORF Transcript_14976/g.26533 Transcript_14976/m.26533 type:complete len:212 (-) Transcript_14976:580-1215(-)
MRGMEPRIICQPVAITGSTYFDTHLTITVPTAMDCAASSIHHSPESQIELFATTSPDAAGKPSPASSDVTTSGGTSNKHRPATPTTRPHTPSVVSDSPNNSAAITATDNGCESIITLPSPALVRCSPSARKPWKHAPSTIPKREMASHAIPPLGCLRPVELAHTKTIRPAGSSLHALTASGVVCKLSSFMETILVPQKKKGEMRSRKASVC